MNSEDTYLKGTCLTMCSNSEMHMRIKNNLIHPLETKLDRNGQRLQYADCKKMVKVFSRSSAGHQIKASDVRPFPILLRTVKYLCSVVCNSEDASWREIYDFVSDRLRAIRQDLVVQGLNNRQVISVLAPAVRFYLYSYYRLCELDRHEFDPYLNQQQLNETLLIILSIYKDNDYVDDEVRGIRHLQCKGKNPESQIPDSKLNDGQSKNEESSDSNESNSNPECKDSNGSVKSSSENDSSKSNCDGNSKTDEGSSYYTEFYDYDESEEEESQSLDDVISYTVFEEMVILYLLINIGKHEVITCVLEMPKRVRNISLIRKTVKASINWMLGNHFPLVRLISELTPILASALHLQWNEIQRYILGVSSVAFSNKMLTYDLDDLKSNLLFSSNQSLQKACQYYGLSTSNEGVQFLKANFKWDIPVLKPEKSTWIEEKMESCSIPDLLLT